MLEFPARRSFYRIVRQDPPAADDFRSARAFGRPPPADQRLAALWDGVSVWSTLDAARRKARAYPALGRFAATITIPTDEPGIRVRKTLGRGHFTVWAEPLRLLELVVDTVAIEG